MVILPERILPEVIETGVRLLAKKSITVELFVMDKPELFAEVISFSRLTPERFNFQFAPLRLRALVFFILPLPSSVNILATASAEPA